MFTECWKLGLYWKAIVHDWTKFLPIEFFPCARFYFKNGIVKRDGKEVYKKPSTLEMSQATIHHIGHGKHHWQFYVLHRDNGVVEIVEIPEKYRLEMLADWRGAARHKGNDIYEWWVSHRDTITIHYYTKNKMDIDITGEERVYTSQ